MKTKMKWRVDSRNDNTCNSWTRGMRFRTKREATEAARDFRKSVWSLSWKVVPNK
jgi:hypothetical protein